MKFNYKISYIFETIVRSEQQLEEHIIKYGEESWPIVRNMLWINLRHIKRGNILKIQQENSLLQSRYINFKRFKLFLINAYRKISYFFSRKDFLKESEVIFFSNSIFLEKINQGILFDRIIDVIYQTSLLHYNPIKIYIDNPIFKEDLFFKGINYFPNINLLPKEFKSVDNFDKKEYKILKDSGLRLLKLFIEFNNLFDKEDLLISQLKKDIKLYLISKRKSKEFLRRFSSLKKIFLISWYLPEMMGIIASAKQLGITTIEVQHGQQGKFHAGNYGWNFFPENGFPNMPDKFWCWGKKSIKNILKDSPNRKFHKPILGGYAWPNWYKTYVKNTYNKQSIIQGKIRLLFTIQCKLGDTNKEPFPEGLLRLIKYQAKLYKISNVKTFELRIRLHPNLLNENLVYLRKRLDKLFYSDLISYSSKLKCNFYDDLLWSNHHLTQYSSCALEATIFGIKSAVYGEESYKIFEDEIKNKSITYLENNSKEEILNWILQENNFSKDSYQNSIDINFPDPKMI